MTSPVGSLFSGMLNQFSAGSECGPVIDKSMRRRLLRSVFDTYYADHADKSVIFDTNRLWCARLPALLDLFPDTRIVACVRNVAWVMDSIERLYRANPYENTKLFNDDTERNSVFSRVETLAQRDRLVGYAWSALKEAYYGEHAQSLLLIDYELLAHAPEKCMRLIYDFIGQPSFEHDFERVHYDAPAFDQALGLSGLHKVRPKVSIVNRHTVLPPDLFARYAALSFWQSDHSSAANVIRPKSSNVSSPPAPLVHGEARC